jgi:hypothetical protein
MELRIPPKEIVPFGLRAMKTVALANGRAKLIRPTVGIRGR